MKLIFKLIFGLLCVWNVSASPNITDCEYIDGNDLKVKLICDSIPADGNDRCFNKYIKSNLEKRVILLKTGNCTTETFDSSLLEKFQGMQELDISNLELVTLPNTLEHIEKMQVFNASGNQLKSIPKGLFGQSNDLETIDFSDNKIEKFELSSLSKNAPNLKELFLEGNNLTDFGNTTGVVFPNVTVLTLSEKQISCDLAKNTFPRANITEFCKNATINNITEPPQSSTTVTFTPNSESTTLDSNATTTTTIATPIDSSTDKKFPITTESPAKPSTVHSTAPAKTTTKTPLHSSSTIPPSVEKSGNAMMVICIVVLVAISIGGIYFLFKKNIIQQAFQRCKKGQSADQQNEASENERL